jgi:glyoxylase-like metal-dependent hydrolase (beta-lactamase superfamily II)
MMPDPAPVSDLDRTARHDLLLAGSLTSTGGGVVSSCSLVRDAGRAIVVDPGMCFRQADILEPLRVLGLEPEEVTDVVLSHHHPDHTMNVALFSRAAVHDHWAIYRGAGWESIDADGRSLTPSVRLMRTPGHTAQDISTIVGTPDGIVVCTHLWWTETGPEEDPTAVDPDALHDSRARVLQFAELIVPGHGASFRPSAATPR